ncbi:MAG: repeat-containing protein [Proteobacteria bacterium]|nr:repeat-containing protein [Pseudomonadota bacterium]
MQKKSFSPYWLPVLALGMGLTLSNQAIASAAECGELKNHGNIGPWDYADPTSTMATGENPMGRIKRVENVHFNPQMQSLDLKKFSIERLTSEFNYTLRVFPNHPRALLALSKLEGIAGGKLPQNSITPFTPKITADCFFDRAIRFRPNDKAVRIVYGMHLQQRGKLKEALVEYELAKSLGENSASFNYNFGLLHADMKNWDKAYEYAVKAQNAGLMLPGLRGKLEKAGRPLPALMPPEKVSASTPAVTD